MRDWQETTIDQAVQINPPVKISTGTNAPFVDMKQVEPGHKFVRAAEWRTYTGGGSKFISGDTLMARITPCLENGKIGQYRSDDGLATNGSTEFIVFRGKPGSTDNEFTYYLITSPDVRNFSIGQMTGTSGRQRVPTDCFSKYTLKLPPLPEQKAIAAVLGALDDKIDLNRRMNATLEAMARALFKSWFVDFDPVRAKMEGKQPFGMDATTATLFPSGLTSSSLGDIPDSWEVGRLSDILELLYGKALTKEARQSGPYPVYGSGGVTGYNSSALVNGPGIVVGRKGTVGILYWEDRNFFPIDTVFYVVPLTYFSLAYSLYQLECLGLKSMNTDAAVPGLNRENAYRLDVIKPPQSIVTAYTNIASEIRSRIQANNAEIGKLATTCDYLLPKLISGDIRIPDAEKFLETA
jgi:type I restriction enzyme, S subunit